MHMYCLLKNYSSLTRNFKLSANLLKHTRILKHTELQEFRLIESYNSQLSKESYLFLPSVQSHVLF